MIEVKDFTNFEKTRILGARALQVAMDAPLLKKIPEKELDAMNYDAIEIAENELNAGVLPITVKQPMPQKKALKLTKVVKREIPKDEEIIKKEEAIEKEIAEQGEIMELANPEDETVEEVAVGREASEELK